MSNLPSVEEIAAHFDYDPVSGSVSKDGVLVTRLNSSGYISVSYKGRELRAHRIAWVLVNGWWPAEGTEIDHKNGDRADNRLDNLRLCTRAQNMMNSKKQTRPTTSRHKGVYYHSRDRKWRAAIKAGGKIITLGSFRDEDAAAACYAEAADRYFGEFSRKGEA